MLGGPDVLRWYEFRRVSGRLHCQRPAGTFRFGAAVFENVEAAPQRKRGPKDDVDVVRQVRAYDADAGAQG